MAAEAALINVSEEAREMAQACKPRMFSTVYCSQCGADFPGAWRDSGFSACIEHATPDTHALLFSRLQGAL